MNSVKTPDGEELIPPITETDKYKNEHNSSSTNTLPSENSTVIDAIGVLAGLARTGADDVDVSQATDETLMAIVQYMDRLKTKMFGKVHGTAKEPEVQATGAENGGDETWQITTRNQTVRKVELR